jgi:hypothetical protein
MKNVRSSVSDTEASRPSKKCRRQGDTDVPTAAPSIVYNINVTNNNMAQGSILNYFASASSSAPTPPTVPMMPSGKDDKDDEEEDVDDDEGEDFAEVDDDDEGEDFAEDVIETKDPEAVATNNNKLDLQATDIAAELKRCIELVDDGVDIANLQEIFTNKLYKKVIKGRCNNKLRHTLLSSWMHNVKHADVTIETVMKSGNRLNNDGIIEMMCFRCHVYQPRDLLHFTINGRSGQFFTSKAGYECLYNSASRQCLQCQTPTFGMAMDYKKDGMSEYILKEKLEEQGGRCLITNAVLVNKKHAKTNAINLCRIDNAQGHTPANTYLSIANVNPTQHDAIEDLRLFYPRMWRHVIDETKEEHDDVIKRKKALIRNLDNTPAQNGVSANRTTEQALYNKQMRDLHLMKLISSNVSHHVDADVNVGRLTFDNAKSKAAYAKKAKKTVIAFLKAHPTLTCSVSGLPLTIKNGPFRLSFDRNDDNLPHFGVDGTDMSNINLRGRVFNTPKKMTKKLLLTYTLSQITVPMTAERRLELEQRLAM